MSLPIDKCGIWLTDDASYHTFDPDLAAALCDRLQGYSVLDVGCGTGAYVKALRAAGIFADGLDGNPHTPELSGGTCGVMDFSKPVWLGRTYDFVMCLEVGEHIPAEFETALILNLTGHAEKGIILSWALPGQGGHAHVNERSNEYIEELFEWLLWVVDPRAKAALRQAARLRWLQKTIMVFIRPEYAREIYPGLLYRVMATGEFASA